MPPLSGRRIVDLSSGIAGAYCTKILADAGADVVLVEPPGGNPLRGWSASGGEPVLFSFLSSSKLSVVVDPSDPAALWSLLETADAVVWSAGSSLTDLPGLTPAVILETAPHLTVTAVSPFGLDGPWSGRAATEFTLQAWSGAIIGLGRGDPDRTPVFVGGQIGEWLTGADAAAGTLVSMARGGGELVDVSMLETLALRLTYFPVTFTDIAGRPFRPGRSVVTPGVETTSDGLVGVGVGTGQQWLDFCVMVGHPEWGEDPSLFRGRGQLRLEIAAWMAEHTTAEVLDLAGAFRIPHAPIGNGRSIPITDHALARGATVPNPRDGFAEPARPFRFDPPVLTPPEPAPRLGEHTGKVVDRVRHDPPIDSSDLPMAGLRVLDLTSFWAGPSCTHALALLGAEVIHVESTRRPDGTRLLAELPFTEPDWWEKSGIFSGLNSCKKSVTLELGTERGQELLRELLATCDVLVENSTPRVLAQVGVDVEAARAAHPDLVVVRMPGFGLDGPWRDDPAFAFVIEDACGLTWMTGHADQNPLWPYSVGDSNAGVHALCAVLIALEHRRRSGEGLLVEASMMDAALNVTAEQIVEFSANGVVLSRDGNRGPTAAPQNVYPTSEPDSWVAIAVADDDQWVAFVEALGRPEWAVDPALRTMDGRRHHQDEIDEHLARWCAGRTGDELVACLWNVGVPVAKVMQPHDQHLLEQLRARRFFEGVDHPVTGSARHATLPVRWSRGPERFHRRHAPLLGEHNEELLRGIGVSDGELAELESLGVIGRAPVR